MTKRIILAGIVGGVVLFVWGWIAWMLLPLHDRTIKTPQNEDTLVATLRQSITESGFYFFPHHEGAEQTEPPYLVIHRVPMPAMGKLMAQGFLFGIVSALIAAWLLSKTSLVSFGARLQFVTVLGLFASFVMDVPNWNWWGFPTDYTVANVADHVIGWLLAGLALAAIVKPKTA
jgi:hypothetical protein